RSVYSTSSFFQRLSLYVGAPVDAPVERFVPLSEWWSSGMRKSSAAANALRAHVLEHTGEVESVLESLRAFRAPRSMLPKESAFGVFYVKLAKLYADRAKDVRIGHALPGPLDGRHPGFSISWSPKRGLLEVCEKSSALLAAPLRLGVVIQLDEPRAPLSFDGHAFAEYGAGDAWELFALRALLSALHDRTDAAVLELERQLERPVWDHVLEHLASRQKNGSEDREWAMCLLPMYGLEQLSLVPYARSASAGPRAKWKRHTFESILVEEPRPLEREIARLALCAVSRDGRGRRESEFALGTPYAHELLRLLARHPRVLLAKRYDKPDPETDPPIDITAGLVTMTLDRDERGMLTPRFVVDGEPIPGGLARLVGDRASLYRASVSKGRIIALELPAALRSWFDMSLRLGDALAFPMEAAPKVAAAAAPLVAAGIAEIPRAALGEELPYAPVPALRVEWKRDEDGSVQAVLEVMIQAHPGAPFVEAGAGPKLFTFEKDDKRVFVERDPRRELAIAADAIDRIDVDIRWLSGVGSTDSVDATLALAAWIDENPLGWPIEVKVGRRPSVISMADATSKLAVRKIGSYLRLDGQLDVAGIKLTLGDVLEAARHARRYVRVGNGSFLELSKEAIGKLRPLAMATELVPGRLARPEDAVNASPMLHEGFGAVLAQVADLFGRVESKGDLAEYAKRFDARARSVRVPRLDRGELRDYQARGVEWMLRLASWAPGCVLADDMGLGKTVQTAAVLKARAKLGPALVVAPASVSSNWVAELTRFVPSLQVRWYNEDRTTPLGALGQGHVVVVSYGLLLRMRSAFREEEWATVVVDEAQYVKNVLAQRRDAVRELRRSFTIALTGTPLENHLGELFSIVDIVFPGLLGDEATFRERFRRPIEAQRDGERLGVLGALIGPFLLRRTRASVLSELPPRQDITEFLELSLPERKRYLALQTACKKALQKRTDSETPAQLRIALLAALTRLRQMACDVRLVDADFDGPSTKIARAVELAKELAEEGNRALVFSQFTQFLDRVRSALAEAGLRVASLTGETPTTKRKALIDAFQAGEMDVFCVSLLAGGTGLNLTKASYVIHLDPWWNPAAEEQATSRAHRMGQQSPVTVYRLVARGTIEEAVLEMHADKRELASAVLEGKGSPKAISSSELLALLSFGA
ncbi:MAG TPA: DEAD/DEAH box helicase, partial [Labilithrix sp.]|nr:DEAD/DEAH box helicase [Labilithrix sp.]